MSSTRSRCRPTRRCGTCHASSSHPTTPRYPRATSAARTRASCATSRAGSAANRWRVRSLALLNVYASCWSPGRFAPPRKDRPLEIVPGLHRLRTPMTSKALPWITPYLFEGTDGVTLFDSGYGTPEATEALTDELRERGYAPSDVQRLIVSHAHPDHIGMASWLKQRSPDYELVLMGREAEWYGSMHRGGEEWMARSNEWLRQHGVDADEIDREAREHSAGPGQRASDDVAGETARHAHSMPRVAPDRIVSDGEVIAFDGWELHAVWTPGHTPGHLSGYLPAHGFVLTGDHILSRITPNVSVAPEDEVSGRSPLAEFLASLQKVADLGQTRGLPAHEDLIEDLPKRCGELAEHHEHRMTEVLAGVGDGQPTAADVSSRVTWNKPYDTFSIFKKRSALGETLAHLQLLVDEGRVRRVEGDAVRWERA
ncbi:MAG: MBL fold metallo-hydrolase [Dehalococcoidia bacterium]|nr:MBL fold metallo-hydrolase [Dehalococcoidia bacterium]